jgi:superfamily I DNA/RNA helicase
VSFQARLSELNPPQRQAVTTTEGPLLVLAGAGSGKTRVITYRVAYLLSRGVPPDAILAVSFTNKAADEMRERIERLVPPRLCRALTMCTFHALGLQILKAEHRALGYAAGFTIYDTADQLGVLREILRHAHIEDRRLDLKAVLFRISRLKNAGVSPEQFLEQIKGARHINEYDGFAAELYPRYQERMRAFHAFDFDDLLVETLRLLRDHPEVRARWQARFRYLMIDEYQDTNRVQLDLLRILCEPHRNLAVVGDDDQSIYGWRGAEASNILEFHTQFPGAQVVKLEENYRSTGAILKAANAVIRKNSKRHDKTLWTSKGDGDRIQLVVCPDAESEARFVAEEIDLLRARKRYDLSDIAVLYRSNVQARLIEEELRGARIDYRLIGGQAFFDRKEIKDAIAYLKLITHPRDEISLRRVINYPARGIGPGTLERLSALQKVQSGAAPQGQGPKQGVLKGTGKRARTSAGPGAQKTGHADSGEAPSLLSVIQSLARDEVEDDGGIGPKLRTSLGEFSDLIARNAGKVLREGGLREGVKAYLTEVGIFDDIVRAGPTPLQAQRRLRNLESFLESLGRFEERGTGDLAAYLHRLTLSTGDDDADDELTGNVVTLSTLHGAKGLEFKVVFFVGLEEELLPHKRTLYPSETDLSEVAGPTDISEERRLCYVGITRARERLYLSRAEVRGSRMTELARTPSRFLADIPGDLLEERTLDGGGKGQGGGMGPEEEAEFARQQLENLLKMTGSP